jgi:hypothetical protein
MESLPTLAELSSVHGDEDSYCIILRDDYLQADRLVPETRSNTANRVAEKSLLLRRNFKNFFYKES